MGIDIQKYLTEQYKKSIETNKKPGPVLTISREYGCSAREIAEAIADKLNEISSKKEEKQKWTWINKEIFENTAKSLNLKESRIAHVFEGEKKNLIEGIILSTSEKYYTSDLKIKKKIIEIVRSYAEKGHVIIIGLGSVAITRDMANSVHIKLHAPFEWRVEKMAKKLSKSIDETRKMATSIDKKREVLRESFITKSKYVELFDATYNVMTLSRSEIAESVVGIMKARKII
jgi:cytidylate kinase